MKKKGVFISVFKNLIWNLQYVRCKISLRFFCFLLPGAPEKVELEIWVTSELRFFLNYKLINRVSLMSFTKK
jgi:hypothetical protein